MSSGKLFVLEGACDGIGKTTQFDLLTKFFADEGINISNHHFPSYNTYHGAPVEKYLYGEFGSPSELSHYFINGMYAMDRACAWHSKLKADFLQGNVILLDRYTTSSLIYQAALIEDIDERKRFIDWVVDYEYNKLEIKAPDCVIFLYAPFELVTEMRNARRNNDGVLNDVHERDLSFMKKVYDNAMFVAEYLSWNMVRCDDGDKMRSISDIHKDVCSLVKKRMK